MPICIAATRGDFDCLHTCDIPLPVRWASSTYRGRSGTAMEWASGSESFGGIFCGFFPFSSFFLEEEEDAAAVGGILLI